MKMSLSAVLKEIKLLEKKINRLTKEQTFAFLVTREKVVYPEVSTMSKDEAVKDIKSGYQQINDLIGRRTLMKKVLQEANMVTQVTVGGKSMSISEAIDEKSMIDFKKDIWRKMSRDFQSALQTVEERTEKLNMKIDAQFSANSQIKQIDKGSEFYQMLSKTLTEREGVTLVDPLKLEKTIKNLHEEIENFESEVDLRLSEVNASTFVEV